MDKKEASELFRLLINDLEDANKALYQGKATIGAASVLQYGLTTNQNVWAGQLFEWFNEKESPPSPPAEITRTFERGIKLGKGLCDTCIADCAERHDTSMTNVSECSSYAPEPPKTPPVDVGTLEYKGNSVSYIYDKMRAYGKCIDDCWGVMMRHGIKADGETDIADILDKCLTKAPPEMPEVTPYPAFDSVNFNYKDTPIITGYCVKWGRAIGKKPANSCVGCTIPGCKMKGEQDSQSR